MAALFKAAAVKKYNYIKTDGTPGTANLLGFTTGVDADADLNDAFVSEKIGIKKDNIQNAIADLA